MDVNLFCPLCVQQAAQRGDPTEAVRVPILKLRDDGVYPVRCQEGHETRVRLLNARFELLFEVAVYALRDGYTREAVSSFSASLERFYEFYSAVALEATDVDPSQFAAAWKDVANQSERQLGLFIGAHLILTGSAPALLNPNKEVKFRNAVVHKGRIPESSEALAFGEVVLGLVEGALNDLRGRCPESLHRVYERFQPAPLVEVPQPDGSEEVVGAVNILTVLDVKHPREGDTRAGTLASQVERLREAPRDRLRTFTKEQLLAERPDLAGTVGETAEDFQRARVRLEEMLEEEPSDYWALKGLMAVLDHLDEPAELLVCLGRLLRLDPHNPTVFNDALDVVNRGAVTAADVVEVIDGLIAEQEADATTVASCHFYAAQLLWDERREEALKRLAAAERGFGEVFPRDHHVFAAVAQLRAS